MITKDGRDTPIEKLTPENYVVPKGEERAYHAVIEVKQFDQKTGRRISQPRVQKFGKKSFETNVADSLRKQGYDIVILHDPNAWIKEQQAKAAERAEAEAEARKQAEQKRFDDAVAEAVAKELAKRENAKAEEKAPEAANEQAEPANEQAEQAKRGRKAKE